MAEGAIIGFVFSWMRLRCWYLAQLFIRPDIQARGIGQTLLLRTPGQAERNGAENRALIICMSTMIKAERSISGPFTDTPISADNRLSSAFAPRAL